MGTIERGEGDYWQQWVSLAYLEAYAGDTVAARVALDSASAKAGSRGGRRQVDSLRAELRRDSLRPDGGVSVPN
jgi:hypothetical protein